MVESATTMEVVVVDTEAILTNVITGMPIPMSIISLEGGVGNVALEDQISGPVLQQVECWATYLATEIEDTIITVDIIEVIIENLHGESQQEHTQGRVHFPPFCKHIV